ncbi:MAG: aromatic-ring-hydroxylating dioxygenase subunit beta [Alphaproteobacteria bacterium]
MMTNMDEWASVSRFLGLEALYLDTKNWDAWINLYAEDAEYWVPAWDDDDKPTSDPQREISLIYYPNRGGLEDRVFRIRTGRSSSASNAPARTSHIAQLLQIETQGDRLHVRTNWTVNSYKEDTTITYYGWAEYELTPHGDSWRIARRKAYVLNDIANTVLDFYMI